MKNAIATFDLSTPTGKIKAFNATQSAVSLKSVAGRNIEIEGVLQYEGVTEEYGAPQEVTITALFGTDGIVYGSISASIADACNHLMTFFNEYGFETVNITVDKKKSKGERDFLSLSISEMTE